MKTYKHLYPQIYTWENLERACRKARKGKRRHQPAADFEYAWESQLLRLQAELAAQSYQPGPYHSFYIHEPKRRLISAAPFRDRAKIKEPRSLWSLAERTLGRGTTNMYQPELENSLNVISNEA